MTRADLRRTIAQYFSESDLKTICFDLDVDYETISGEDKNNKIIELIKLFERDGRTSILIDSCQSLRPSVSFGEQVKSTTNPAVEELSKKLKEKHFEIQGRKFTLAEVLIKSSTSIASGASADEICYRMFDELNVPTLKSVVWKLKRDSLWYQILDVIGELILMGLLKVQPIQPNGYAVEVYFFTDDGLRVASHLRG